MATTSPARIEDELYASAKLAGDALSRSASQQIAHWARIGREIQSSATISHREIAEVLAGATSYDELNSKEQAVVRAEWAERMAVYRAALDLPGQFVAEGRTWVELDDDGQVVERSAPAARPTPTKPDAKKTAAKKAAAKKSPAPKAPVRKVAKKPVAPRAAVARRSPRVRAAG